MVEAGTTITRLASRTYVSQTLRFFPHLLTNVNINPSLEFHRGYWIRPLWYFWTVDFCPCGREEELGDDTEHLFHFLGRVCILDWQYHTMVGGRAARQSDQEKDTVNGNEKGTAINGL